MKRLTMALMAVLLLSTQRANAQLRPGGNQVSMDLGISNPLSNDNDNGDNETFGQPGPVLGFAYLHTLQGGARFLSLGGDLSLKSLGDENVGTPHGPVDIHSSAWTMMGLARFDLMPDSRVRPYGQVGLGFGGVRSQWNYQNPGFSNSRTSGGAAFSLGGGADFDINPYWFVGGELRYTVIGTNQSDIGTSSVSTFDVLAKVGFKF